jgi:hypothetical protein
MKEGGGADRHEPGNQQGAGASQIRTKAGKRHPDRSHEQGDELRGKLDLSRGR